MNKFFAGIGSRTIPKDVYHFIRNDICPILIKKGYTLRSGGAPGSDTAFESGYDSYGGESEIYLPWKGFNGSDSRLYEVDERALDMARQFHPYWNGMKSAVKKLHGRNCYQVLGRNLDLPVRFVLCYTNDGAERKDQITELTGGTGQALRVACSREIRIINIKNYFSDNFISQRTPDYLLSMLIELE